MKAEHTIFAVGLAHGLEGSFVEHAVESDAKKFSLFILSAADSCVFLVIHPTPHSQISFRIRVVLGGGGSAEN